MIKSKAMLIYNDIIEFETPYNHYKNVNSTFDFKSSNFAYHLLSKNESEAVFLKKLCAALCEQ